MPRLVTLKSTVKPPNLVILAAACNTAAELGISITVTSGNDSAHKVGSRHFTNQAIDFRTKDMEKAVKAEFIAKMKARLGKKYLVLLEDEGKANEHLHCEVD